MKQATAVALWLVSIAAPAYAEMPIERGRYLVESLAACGNCHTPRGPDGPQMDKYLAGGEHLKGKDFDAVGSNITPDPETGVTDGAMLNCSGRSAKGGGAMAA
jgi:mono/diheme cytochrome c family protein